MTRVPVVVVLGATGAGKSQLALELAEKFGGEIISADAMQMYKGLDIVTNKVTNEELSLVKHHVIDFLDPLSKCTVVDFRNKALPIVEDLLKEDKIPFICGGTNYYIESLLWKVLIDEGKPFEGTVKPEAKKPKCDDIDLSSINFENGDDESIPDDVLHRKLQDVDPDRASELHIKDRRKIIRSLQVYQRRGVPHSQLLSEQKSEEGGGLLGGPLRFSNVCVIWVQCDQSVLDDRCNRRVDKMIQRGMMKELEDFHRDYNAKRGPEPDYTVGIFQSIGFKEFHEYLILDSQEMKDSEEGQKLYNKGVEQLKLVTRQYARRQTKWMRNRFLNPNRICPPVYAVDSSDKALWKSKVLEPAQDILQAFVEGLVPSQSPLPLVESKYSVDQLRKIHHCEVCNRDFKGIVQFEIHLNSKKHKHSVHKAKPREQLFKVTVEMIPEAERLAAMKLLKAVSKLPLAEVKANLDCLPWVVNVKLTEENAQKVITDLVDIGADASKVPQ